MKQAEFFKIATSFLRELLDRGIGAEGLVFPHQYEALADSEEKVFLQTLGELFERLDESHEFATELSKGNLQNSVSRSNVFAMPLKALQANLNHLSWQANQVANGNLNQQILFLGDFSSSFNNMILALRDKRVVEQRLQTITDTMGEGLFLVDAEGGFVLANPEALKMLDYRFEELQGRTIHETVFCQLPDGARVSPELNPLWLAIEAGAERSEKDAVFTAKSGALLPVSYTCRPIGDEGSIEGAVISFQDISVQKKYLQSLRAVNELLEKQASTDTLTGICNRLEFDRVMQIESSKVERYGYPLSLILFDIDHFKQVNDQHGHAAGDEVLKNLARIVGPELRDTDLFARWGGEEFVVLCPGNNLPSVLVLAERLRGKIESFDFRKPPTVTASFGVAEFIAGDTLTSFVNRADVALYQAKESGRNRVAGG